MLKYFICYLLFRIFYIIILPLFDKNYKKYGTIGRVVSRMLPESIARLRKELRDTQDALDILKKAIGILGK